MSKQTDIAYIAGLLDGEAYIGIKKNQAYKCQQRQTPGFQARIQIRMVDEAAIKFIAETLGGWYYKEKQPHNNRRVLYAYQAADKRAEEILRTVLPYLKVKRESALTVLRLRELQSNGKQYKTKVTGYRTFPHSRTGKTVTARNLSFSDEYVAMCDQLHTRCKELNHTGV